MKWRLSRSTWSHAFFAGQIGLNSAIGYVFLRILALRYGTSAEKDGFDIAYSVPFLIMSVSGFSFLHGVVTTQFARLRGAQSQRTNEVFSTTLTFMMMIGIALMMGCLFGSHFITDLLAPGLAPAVKEETRILMLLMMPLVVTLGVSTYLSAVLTAYAVAISMEFAQLLTRAGVLVVLFAMRLHFTLIFVAEMLVTMSVVAAVVEVIIVVRSTSLRYRVVFDWRDPEFRTLLRQGTGLLIASAFAQVSTTYMRRLATFDSPGTNAALTYAFSIVSPLSTLLAKPLALTRGPEYVRRFEERDIAGARDLFLRVILLSAVAGIVCAVAINSVAPLAIRILYGGGKFDARSIRLTSGLFTALNWSLPGAMLLWVTLHPLLNMSRTQLAAVLYSGGYLVQLALMYLLFPSYGRSALAWAYTAATTAQAIIGIIFIYGQLAVSRRRMSAELS